MQKDLPIAEEPLNKKGETIPVMHKVDSIEIHSFPMSPTTRFLKDVVINPKIIIGDYTYGYHEEGVYVFE